MNPILALIIANVIWGGASPIFKYALENIPPFTLAFIRFFFAGLIFLPWANRVWKDLTFKEWGQAILVGFFGITVNISFFFLGIQKTESINAPVIASSGPIFIYILSIFFLKEKPKLKILSGMMVAFLGVLIIIFSPVFMDGKRWVLGEVEGNLFIFVAMLGAVFQTILGRNLLKKVSFVQVSAITFLLSSLTFLPFIPKEFMAWDWSMLNLNGWVGIIYGVLFSSAAAYTLFYYGVSKIKAQEVGLFTYIDPIVAVMIAAPLLGELPSVYYFLGTVLVFGGIYFAEGRINYHPFYLFIKKQSAPIINVLHKLEKFA
jgi:drug/metabolite transporter (DMT)-like permease